MVTYSAAFIERFWRRVEKGNGCWFWTGARTNKNVGYGVVATWDKELKKTVNRLAHRVSYELHHGPIPHGLTIDHVCHNGDASCVGGGARCKHRICVNPNHLEAVTGEVNVLRGFGLPAQNARKTTCARGHALHDSTNSGHKRRRCRTCQAGYSRTAYWKLKAIPKQNT